MKLTYSKPYTVSDPGANSSYNGSQERSRDDDLCSGSIFVREEKLMPIKSERNRCHSNSPSNPVVSLRMSEMFVNKLRGESYNLHQKCESSSLQRIQQQFQSHKKRYSSKLRNEANVFPGLILYIDEKISIKRKKDIDEKKEFSEKSSLRMRETYAILIAVNANVIPVL